MALMLLSMGCDGSAVIDAGGAMLDAGDQPQPDAGAAYTGHVEVTDDGPGTQILAQHFAAEPSELATSLSPCRITRRAGDCMLADCIGVRDRPEVPAGTLEVEGDTGPIARLSAPTRDPFLYAWNADTRVVSAGQRLSISAAGDEFPAYAGSVVWPAPPARFSVPGAVDVTAGWTVSWSTEGVEAYRIRLSVALPSRGYLLCLGDPAEGAIVVEPGLLVNEPRGVDAPYWLRAENMRTLREGTTHVTLVAGQGQSGSIRL